MESPASPVRLRYGPTDNSLHRSTRLLWPALEIVLLSALILGTRCANFGDVFVEGKIYFVDADCYARMTRARLVAQYPGLVVRHHDFENYPDGVDPHTSAPLDYLIVGLAALLRPFTGQPLDLAGAIVSPLLALIGGWFLWWWSRRMRFRYGWGALLLFALSPILAQGTALGRPDHQSLLIVLTLVALAAEWSLAGEASRAWTIVSGLSWGLALWVSFYEPLFLLGALLAAQIHTVEGEPFARDRRLGWYLCGAVLLLAALVERRLPPLPDPALRTFLIHWSATLGEMQRVGLTNPVWLEWFGGFILLAPVLLALAVKQRLVSMPFAVLLGFTFLFTLWQARWGYFFAVLLALTVPALFAVVRRQWLGGLVIAIAILPCLQYWDGELWPNEQVAEIRAAARRETVEWRAAATALPHDRPAPFLAPWWLSPAAAYWSGQPGVAGSSHESLAGIVATAHFFVATQRGEAVAILRRRGVRWILSYDADRVAENSAAILGVRVPPDSSCFLLDRNPSRVSAWLVLRGQNSTAKVYEVRD
ncbi:MAG TPA: hypothetical protein VGI85_14420 [Chthoniobacterales bacterium]|jgi:hypothetical protein